MQILSALDAISPAIARTKLVLFTPFRKGRTWKLAATGYVTLMGTFFLPYFLLGFFFIPMARQAGGSSGVAILVSACSAATLIYVVVFYLCSRLRFAFFDVVLNRGEFVAPAWRKYGPQSFKWTAFKVVLGTLSMAVVAVPLAAWVRHMIPIFTAMQVKPGQQQDTSPEVMAAIFTMYGAFFLMYFVVGLFWFVSSLLSDFIVPSLALEDTTLGEAFRRLGKLIRREPGQFTLYAAMKLVLALVGYMAQMLAFYIVFFVVVVILGLVGIMFGYMLHALGVSTTALTVLGICVAVPVYFFLFFYVMFMAIGTVMTFLEAYTLYFLGGRYPMLGELLDGSTPPRPTYMPPPEYPAYAYPPPQ
jgi:hypothetical protein